LIVTGRGTRKSATSCQQRRFPTWQPVGITMLLRRDWSNRMQRQLAVPLRAACGPGWLPRRQHDPFRDSQSPSSSRSSVSTRPISFVAQELSRSRGPQAHAQPPSKHLQNLQFRNKLRSSGPFTSHNPFYWIALVQLQYIIYIHDFLTPRLNWSTYQCYTSSSKFYARDPDTLA